MASGRSRSASGRGAYPDGVPGWLVNGDDRPRPLRVLDIGSGRGGLAKMLVERGHQVHCLDRDLAVVDRLPGRVPGARVIAGQVECLPFDACHFDVVTAAQNLHAFAPGLAFAEIARVLAPSGHLAIAYNTRDDTVPWVRKLTRLMQSIDPEAMRGDFGTDSVAAVDDSAYFTVVGHKAFRNWVPITRPRLLEMVAERPGTQRLDPEARERLVEGVGALYDDHARAPEPLLLPFTASCWRARVDHTELTVIGAYDPALQISLDF